MSACNILVTGATSVLGRQLVQRLLLDRSVDHVVALATDPMPYYFKDCDTERLVYLEVDPARWRDLAHVFEEQPVAISHVAHMAFQGNPGEYAGRSTHTSNLKRMRNILRWAEQVPTIEAIVHLSRDLVYYQHGDCDALITEDDDLNFSAAAHPIIRDAVDAEMLCQALLGRQKPRMIILRPSGIVGRNLSTFPCPVLESVVCLVPWGYDPMINPIHSVDVVRAVHLALKTEARGIYNVAGKDVAPLSEFMRRAGVIGMAAPYSLHPLLGGLLSRLRLTSVDSRLYRHRMRYSMVLDASRIRDELGFEPTEHIKFRYD